MVVHLFNVDVNKGLLAYELTYELDRLMLMLLTLLGDTSRERGGL